VEPAVRKKMCTITFLIECRDVLWAGIIRDCNA